MARGQAVREVWVEIFDQAFNLCGPVPGYILGLAR
jgi:hypothetical protein